MGQFKRYESRNQIKPEKPDIRKMMKYTVKKILWVTNYSLSFSKKDTRKEIFIKFLGCAVILQSLSLIVSFSLNTVQIFLINPLSAFGFFLLMGIFIFKEEIISFLQLRNLKNKTENVYRKNHLQTGIKK